MKYLFIYFLSFLHFSLVAQQTAPSLQDINIGTKWIYETTTNSLPIRTGFQTFEITDTIQLEGVRVFVIENDQDNRIEYLFIYGSRIYFWDEALYRFQLTYDFGTASSFPSPWEGICEHDTGTAIVHIDSTSSFIIDTDTVTTQHISITNNGTLFEEDIHTEAYKNIGHKFFGLRLPLGLGLCDFPVSITQLRCFENDSVNYNFVGYACDSVWFSLATPDVQEDKSLIFPNPTTGAIQIMELNEDVSYELYNDLGIRIQSGVTTNKEIQINHDGIFILRLLINKKWTTSKVIVIN